MAVPTAKTKMTRNSKFGKGNQKNKEVELSLSQDVVVAARFGVESLASYAKNYMSRDQAALGINNSDVQLAPNVEGEGARSQALRNGDVSDELFEASRPSRLFSNTNTQLDEELANDKLDVFRKAQAKGHVPLIQVISFTIPQLIKTGILPENAKADEKGDLSTQIDQAKLRTGMQSALNIFLQQAGFNDGQWVASIHGNTQHVHVHVAMIETDDDADGRLVVKDKEEEQLIVDADEQFKTWLKVINGQGENQEPATGKTKAALKAQETTHNEVVERGMLRSSEMDFLRQTIIEEFDSLSLLKHLDRDLTIEMLDASIQTELANKVINRQVNLSQLLDLYMSLPVNEARWELQKEGSQQNLQLTQLVDGLIKTEDFSQEEFLKTVHVSAITKSTSLENDKAYVDSVIKHLALDDVDSMAAEDLANVSMAQRYDIYQQLIELGATPASAFVRLNQFMPSAEYSQSEIEEQIDTWIRLGIKPRSPKLVYQLIDVENSTSVDRTKPIDKMIRNRFETQLHAKQVETEYEYLKNSVGNAVINILKGYRDVGLTDIEMLNNFENELSNNAHTKIVERVTKQASEAGVELIDDNGFITTSDSQVEGLKKLNRVLETDVVKHKYAARVGINDETLAKIANRYAPNKEEYKGQTPIEWQMAKAFAGTVKYKDVPNSVKVLTKSWSQKVELYTKAIKQVKDTDKLDKLTNQVLKGELPDLKTRLDITRALPLIDVSADLAVQMKGDIENTGDK